jgi:diguanylate cyclase (GGDEF)-like protein/putative nucleotidyltransferase with HDIG domain
LEAEVARARHDQTDLALVMIDLDLFKEVNDTFGHHVGDAVLSEAARRLAGEARFGEVVARVGGEEFAWILPGSDGLNAWRAAERARQAVAEAPFADGVGSITASAGVADLNQASDAATLMRLADGALYWAKASGRDATFRYSPDVVRELSASERAERLAKTQAVTALRALARAVDAKDPSTARHAERVANVAVRIGRHLGWEPDRLELLREAALLHDVGKIGVPDSLLFKPDRLTGPEKQQVEAHAALGAEIVSDVLTPEQVTWVRGHHERWDGLGYPDRIGGENLAAGARIISVADAWDAMTSVRTYGRTREGAEAVVEIEAESGRQFCPEAAMAMIELWNEGMLDDDPVPGRTTSQSPQ